MLACLHQGSTIYKQRQDTIEDNDGIKALHETIFSFPNIAKLMVRVLTPKTTKPKT